MILRIFISFLFMVLNSSAELSRVEKVKALVEKITYHQRLYDSGKREISDFDYDQLVERLAALAPKYEVLNGSVESTGKLSHKKLMKSLAKVYEKQALFKWLDKNSRSSEEKFLVQIKYDGIAINVQDGRLISRGNGRQGRDLSQLDSFLKQGDSFKSAENYRAELVMSWTDFQRLKKSQDFDYVSPRHAVVALANRHEENQVEDFGRCLKLMPFKAWQKVLSGQEIREQWTELVKEVRASDYPNDGIVIKLADETYRKTLSATAKYPAGMMAFKWKGLAKMVQLKSVDWSFSERGLVPVACFEQVLLEGRKIQRTNLYNWGYIQKKDLAIGDFLWIELKGGTIPIIRRIEEGIDRKPIELKSCPACSAKVEERLGKLLCSSTDCVGKVSLELYKRYKKAGGKGLGLKTVQKIVKTLKLKSWQDFVSLSKADLRKVSGIGKKKSVLIEGYLRSAGEK